MRTTQEQLLDREFQDLSKTLVKKGLRPHTFAWAYHNILGLKRIAKKHGVQFQPNWVQNLRDDGVRGTFIGFVVYYWLSWK